MKKIEELYNRRKFLLRKKIKERPLEIVIWEATTKCNLHCIHCGSPPQHITELTADEVIGAFKNIREQFGTDKIKYIAITGGEPTVREDLLYIIQEIKSLGFKHIAMQTNGHRIGEENGYIDKLIEAGIEGIGLNIDGTEETHNWLRNNKDSFNLSVRAFKLIKKAQINNLISTIIMKRTLEKLEETKNFIAKLSPDRWRLIPLEPIGRAGRNLKDQILNYEDTEKLLNFVIQNRMDGFPVELGCGQWYGKEYEGLVRPYIWHCIAGITVMSVLADGSLATCNNISRHYIQGNIKTDNIRDVWENRYKPFRVYDWKKTGVCANCSDWDLCHGGDMHLRDENGDVLKACFFHEKQIRCGSK